MWSVERVVCSVLNAESVKCRVPRVKCRVPTFKCKVRSVKRSV